MSTSGTKHLRADSHSRGSLFRRRVGGGSHSIGTACRLERNICPSVRLLLLNGRNEND